MKPTKRKPSKATTDPAKERKRAGAGGTPKHNTMAVPAEPGESHEAVMAKLAVLPTMTAATVVKAFASRTFGDVDLTTATAAILEQTKRVHAGNMREVESTLVAQATALNSIFTDLAKRSALNAGEYLGAAEIYMKLALRAQNQCRMTLETLATIKNPPVVFAKQANIAHGHQQVNNGDAVPVAREENGNGQTGLLGNDHGQRLDTGTTRAASRDDSPLETVAVFDRPAHGSGQRQGKP